jgi:5'-nucleotidase
MTVDLSKSLVIGISSSVLFDMSEPDYVFRTQGLAAYADYQIKNADIPLPPGTGMPLVKAVLRLNHDVDGNANATRRAEIVVASKNAPSTSMRLYNSIKHHGLNDIQRSFLSGGAPIAQYLEAFSVDLFLSTSLDDVETALHAEIPAAQVYAVPENLADDIGQIRIAFDGDAVLFSDESEAIYQAYGLKKFIEHEQQNVNTPLPEGPFFRFLKVLSFLQNDPQFAANSPVRIALVTARSMPTHERVIKTLNLWNVRIDEAFFMGGVSKTQILHKFKPHLFFDDQEAHCLPASSVVPTGHVPYGIKNRKKDNSPIVLGDSK